MRYKVGIKRGFLIFRGTSYNSKNPKRIEALKNRIAKEALQHRFEDQERAWLNRCLKEVDQWMGYFEGGNK